MKRILLVLIVCTFSTQTYGQSNCTANSHYTDCLNNCPVTCANRKVIAQQGACIQVCRSAGCQCDSGFMADNVGNCVTENECPKSCEENEVLNTCGNGCGIKNEQTCEGLRKHKPIQLAPPGVACPAVCTELCECAKGFVRRNDGFCVPPRKCRGY